jgi:lysozyme family protein
VRSGFYQTNRDEALAIAEEVYSNEYIPHLDLAQINRTAVAIAILSFAVVEGAGRAVLILQRVLVAMGFPLVQDGSVGPKTIAAINAADPLRLVMALVRAHRSYFQQIVANDPSQSKWLNGWNNRAIAILTYSQRALVQ